MSWTEPQTSSRWKLRTHGWSGLPVKSGRRWGRWADVPIGPRFEALDDDSLVLIFESVDHANERLAVSGAPEDWPKRPEILPELFARAKTPGPRETLNWVDKISVQLAKRIAVDLAIYDRDLVLEIVRWRYVGTFAAYRMYHRRRHWLTVQEYELARKRTETELMRRQP